MKRLFVDAAGWVAMADSKDPRHSDCRRVRDERIKKVLTVDRHFLEAGFETLPLP